MLGYWCRLPEGRRHASWFEGLVLAALWSGGRWLTTTILTTMVRHTGYLRVIRQGQGES